MTPSGIEPATFRFLAQHSKRTVQRLNVHLCAWTYRLEHMKETRRNMYFIELFPVPYFRAHSATYTPHPDDHLPGCFDTGTTN